MKFENIGDLVRRKVHEKLNSINLGQMISTNDEIFVGSSPPLHTAKTLRMTSNVTNTQVNSKDSLVSNTKDNNPASQSPRRGNRNNSSVHFNFDYPGTST